MIAKAVAVFYPPGQKEGAVKAVLTDDACKDVEMFKFIEHKYADGAVVIPLSALVVQVTVGVPLLTRKCVEESVA